jgi:hypothetical protein
LLKWIELPIWTAEQAHPDSFAWLPKMRATRLTLHDAGIRRALNPGGGKAVAHGDKTARGVAPASRGEDSRHFRCGALEEWR